LHPYLFAGAYLLADKGSGLLGVQSQMHAEYLVMAPKILQALLAALMDYFTWRLARKIFSGEEAPTTAAVGEDSLLTFTLGSSPS